MRITLLTLVAGLVLGGVAYAGEDCLKDCPTAQKVTALNAKWQAAGEKLGALTPEQQQVFAAKVGDVAKKCPVGSRMGVTLATVRDVLALAAAPCEQCQDCPTEKLDADSDIAKQAKQLKTARTAALAQLHTLATHAAGATCQGCQSECSEGQCADAGKDGSCATDCATQKGNPIRIASRVGALRASFGEAQRVAGAMSSKQKGEILVGFGKLAAERDAITLIPQSIVALTEGFEALHAIHGKMGALMKANPDIAAKIPAALRMKMMTEITLVDETRQLLGKVAKTMKTMQTTDAEVVAETAER